MRKLPSSVYLSPEELMGKRERLRWWRLRGSLGGVVLRVGFDPKRPDPLLAGAVEAAQELGLEVCLLLGTWWGEGVTPPRPLARAAEMPEYGPAWAHESRWTMGFPDAVYVAEGLAELVKRHRPLAVCLTHARFPHVADFGALFGMGEGLVDAELRSALGELSARVSEASPAELERWSDGGGLSGFLGGATGSVVFERWFGRRCALIESAYAALKEACRDASDGQTMFGANAMGPLFSLYSGQDYARLSEVCDFLQPLLGYMRWHVWQPIGSWARFLAERRAGLDFADAVRIAARLFQVPDELCPKSPAFYEESDEGEGRSIDEIALVQYRLARKRLSEKCQCMPVYRGDGGWPMKTLRRAIARTRRDGLAFALQGTVGLERE